MTLAEFNKILQSTELPVAYRFFPADDPRKPPPNPPFICYFETETNNFAADGVIYKKIARIAVELYTEKKDLVSEEKVESALSSFYWNKDEEYLNDEKCYFVVYQLEVMIDG